MRELLTLLEKTTALIPLAVAVPGTARKFVVGSLRLIADAIEGNRTITTAEMAEHNGQMADIEARLYGDG